MIGSGEQDLETVAPPLSWRVWLLLPLALVSLLGLAVPQGERATAPKIRKSFDAPVDPEEVRVPYRGELEALYLDGRVKDVEERLRISRLHQGFAADAADHDGTIPKSHWAEVERLLKIYR